MDRFGGRQNAAALLGQTADGIAGVDAYLQPFDTSFRDVFADWLVANYLDAAEGPYAHEGADLKVTAAPTIDDARAGSDTVHQFAADYLAFDPPAGGATFTFDGSDEVGVGIEPFDGAFWWSNQGDSIDSRLTQEFDLTGLTSATLRFPRQLRHRVWLGLRLRRRLHGRRPDLAGAARPTHHRLQPGR